MVGLGLQQKLSVVVSRLAKVRVLRHQTRVWLLLLIPAAGLVLLLPLRADSFRPEIPVLLGTTLLGILIARLMVRQPSLAEAARLVEQRDNGLQDVVLTAVEMVIAQSAVLSVTGIQCHSRQSLRSSSAARETACGCRSGHHGTGSSGCTGAGGGAWRYGA